MLVIGGGMFALSKIIPGMINGFAGSAVPSMELAPGEEMPAFVMALVAKLMEWCMAGIEKVGTYGLMAAVLLVLMGILLRILQKDKAEAESVMGMR